MASKDEEPEKTVRKPADTWAPDDVRSDTTIVDPDVDDSGVRFVAAADRYELGRLLGRGGMGEVRRAWDHRLRRNVAMKVLAPGREDAAARFAQEAQIAGQLEHPNIVPVHDLDRGPDGSLFLTMKEVRGQELSDEMTDVRAAVRDGEIDTLGGLVRLVRILLKVCDGLAFAHSCDVVHRDLKPANIMVGEFGEVQVMDWGLARIGSAKRAGLGVTSDRLDDSIDMSRAGSVIGSPPYMAPEQARGELHEIDARTDVFAVGSILYEVLTGTRPWNGETATDVLAKARTGKVEPPSIRAPAAGIPRDLEAIVLKAMATEKEGRYPSMTALADDLTAWLEGRPLATVQYGVPELALKWIRRNRPLVTGVTTTAMMAAVVLGVGLYRYVADTKAETERALYAEAEVQETLATQQVRTADAFAAAGRFADARQTYADALIALEATNQDTLSAELGLWETYHQAPAPMATLSDGDFEPRAMTANALVGLQNDSWVQLELPSGRRVGEWPLRGRPINAFFRAEKPVVYEDVGGRAMRRDLHGGTDEGLFRVTFDNAHIDEPEGADFILEHGGKPASSNIWTEGPEGWTSRELTTLGTPVWADADYTIVSKYRRPSFLLKLPGGDIIRQLDRYHVKGTEFDGRLVLYNESLASLRMEDIETGKVLWTRPDSGIRVVRFADDGALLFISRITPAIEVVDARTGETLTHLEGHTRATHRIYASGGLLVSMGADRRTLLWGRPDFQRRGHLKTMVGRSRVSPDGRLLVMVNDDIRVTDITTGLAIATHPLPFDNIRDFSIGDGEIALFANNGPSAAIDLLTGEATRLLDEPAFAMALIGDDLVAMGDVKGSVGVWDRETGESRWLKRLTFEAVAWHLTASADGKILYGTGFQEGEVVAWDVATGEERFRSKVGGKAYETSLDPTSDRIAVGTWDGRVGVFDGTGKRLHDFSGYDGPFLATAFSPDGKYVAGGCFDATLRYFDVETGDALRTERTHDGPLAGVWWNEGRLISAAGDNRVIVRELDLPDRLHAGNTAFESVRILPIDGEVSGPEERKLAEALDTHGVHHLAFEAWDRAVALGENVDNLTIARAAWKAGELERAAMAFDAAMESEEAPKTYLALCRQAVSPER